MQPIITLSQTAALGKLLHQKGQKIVLTGGCFDILHIGHIALFEQAKQHGDVLVVLLESDESITKSKGEDRPLHSQEQRAKVLTALRAVDYIILLPPDMTNEDYDGLVKALQPDIIATTEGDSGWLHKKRQAELIGAQLIAVTKPIPNVSTSRIVSRLQEEL